METLWIITSALVISVVAGLVKLRRPAVRNLGYVSRDWVVRHGTDHTSA